MEHIQRTVQHVQRLQGSLSASRECGAGCREGRAGLTPGQRGGQGGAGRGGTGENGVEGPTAMDSSDLQTGGGAGAG